MEKLNTIAENQLRGILDAYEGETREFFGTVSDDDVYAALEDPDFQAFVRLIEAVGLSDGNQRAA